MKVFLPLSSLLHCVLPATIPLLQNRGVSKLALLFFFCCNRQIFSITPSLLSCYRQFMGRSRIPTYRNGCLVTIPYPRVRNKHCNRLLDVGISRQPVLGYPKRSKDQTLIAVTASYKGTSGFKVATFVSWDKKTLRHLHFETNTLLEHL
jgi:hypothetical protein